MLKQRLAVTDARKIRQCLVRAIDVQCLFVVKDGFIMTANLRKEQAHG